MGGVCLLKNVNLNVKSNFFSFISSKRLLSGFPFLLLFRNEEEKLEKILIIFLIKNKFVSILKKVVFCRCCPRGSLKNVSQFGPAV